MITFCRRNRRGMTMIEVTISMAVTTLVVVGTIAMILQTARRCETEVSQTATDTNAVLALHTMVNDVREAKRVERQDNNTRLMIIKPIRALQGYYDRSAEDTLHPIYYYLSDSTGTMGRGGTYLWRREITADGVDLRMIRKDMDPEGLVFEQDVPKSIQITVRTKEEVSKYAAGRSEQQVYTQLTDRVVYLRNH